MAATPRYLPPQVSIRTLRECHELTLADLAARIGAFGVKVTIFTLSNVELGHKRAGKELASAWAKALGLHPLDMRQEDDLRALICGERHAS